MKYIFLCILNVALLVTGQTMFKYATKGREIDSIKTILSLIFTPFVLSGLIVYIFSTVLWLYILSKIPISYAYPIQALAYPFVFIIAGIFFNEGISIIRWIGAGVIILGVILAVQG